MDVYGLACVRTCGRMCARAFVRTHVCTHMRACSYGRADTCVQTRVRRLVVTSWEHIKPKGGTQDCKISGVGSGNALKDLSMSCDALSKAFWKPSRGLQKPLRKTFWQAFKRHLKNSKKAVKGSPAKRSLNDISEGLNPPKIPLSCVPPTQLSPLLPSRTLTESPHRFGPGRSQQWAIVNRELLMPQNIQGMK